MPMQSFVGAWSRAIPPFHSACISFASDRGMLVYQRAKPPWKLAIWMLASVATNPKCWSLMPLHSCVYEMLLPWIITVDCEKERRFIVALETSINNIVNLKLLYDFWFLSRISVASLLQSKLEVRFSQFVLISFNISFDPSY